MTRMTGPDCVVMCNLINTYIHTYSVLWYLKENQNALRPSEHPPVRGENVKTIRSDHRLQIQNLFIAFKRFPLW